MPGDWVLAQDESDPESAPTIRQVEELFENQAQVMVLGLGDWTIETTPVHPFWVRDRGWIAADQLEPGDELRSHDGCWIPLESKHLTDSIITVYNMRVAEDHTYFIGSPLWGFSVWAHNSCDVQAKVYPNDYKTRKTKNRSANFRTEGEARHVAQTMIGPSPVQVELHKYRSIDGKWQYRAKDVDLLLKHVHIERLNPKTGEVLVNWHLYWEISRGI